MYKYKKIISLLSIPIISALMLSCVSAEQKALETEESISIISVPNAAIDFYKTVMNDSSWKENTNRAERGEMLQLPEYVLKNITTDELIEAVLNYPFFSDIYAFNNIRVGINSLFKEFNGFKELFKRDDAAEEILKAYENEPVFQSENSSRNKDVFRLNYLEILLLNEDIILKMSDRQIDDLYNAISDKLEQKMKSAIYGEHSKNLIYELLDVDPYSKNVQIDTKKALSDIMISKSDDVKTSKDDTEIKVLTEKLSVTMWGDANSDGVNNVRDCAFIANVLANGNSESLPDTADYNKDGKKNVRDAAAISKDLASK